MPRGPVQHFGAALTSHREPRELHQPARFRAAPETRAIALWQADLEEGCLYIKHNCDLAKRSMRIARHMPQCRPGFAIVVVVFALRPCNEAPSQSDGFSSTMTRGAIQPFASSCDASQMTPNLSIILASASSIRKLVSWFDKCGPGV
ncbi:hypothetical protein ERJ75_001797700 [Trypanosoma vivax]|nr:hypothetical protein ERJ75_001797700 [Trypanosoma vivax]